MRNRRLHIEERKKQRKLLVFGGIFLFLFLCTGYAAFSTNISFNAKGNVKKMNASSLLKTKVVTSGDGLYKDMYEDDRFVYRGSTPNNYIKLDDNLYRIISVESDNTLKVIKNDSIGSMAWDTNNNGDWDTSSIKDYLNNSFYNSLSNTLKKLVISNYFHIGNISYESDFSELYNMCKSESWYGNVGLISLYEYIEAGTSSICNFVPKNYAECDATNACNQECVDDNSLNNWIYNLQDTGITYHSWQWTINPIYSNLIAVVHGTIYKHLGGDNAQVVAYNVHPVFFLSSDISLTGEGLESDPYIVAQ